MAALASAGAGLQPTHTPNCNRAPVPLPYCFVGHGLTTTVLGVALACFGCGAANGEVTNVWATRLGPAPEEVTLEPTPPIDLTFVKMASARVPPRNRGGQLWDDDGWPDPVAVFYINGKETMRSNTATDTLEATWTAPGGNFELGPNDELRVDLFDDDAAGDTLIGSANFGPPSNEQLREGGVDLEVIKRGLVRVALTRARALIGLGFDYRVADKSLLVLQVLRHSPAGRAGMKAGDRVVAVDGKKTRRMSAKAIKSALNGVGAAGVAIVVKHEGGTTETMRLKEGPVYPIYAEFGGVP